jgi:cysteine desulfurase
MIYLDNNATTRVGDEVFAAMQPFYREIYGNPHAAHQLGRRAHAAVDDAREAIADLLECRASDIIFTSCGSESNAMVLHGYRVPGRNRIIATAVEHPSVLATLRHLEQSGAIRLSIVGVSPEGAIDLDQLREVIDDETLLVCVMLAQNETGVIHPVAEISEIAHEKGARLLVDAVQAVGKIDVNPLKLGADFLSLSGHKFHAPKGVGALYARQPGQLEPLWLGGGQESGLRAGTEAVPSIVGLGSAATVAKHRRSDQEWVRHLRDQLERSIVTAFGDLVSINGKSQPRLPNTSSLSFSGLYADEIVSALDERAICISAGAACHSGKREASSVMQAMGKAPEQALGTVRLSLSRLTTAPQIDDVAAALIDVVRTLHANRNGLPQERTACPS